MGRFLLLVILVVVALVGWNYYQTANPKPITYLTDDVARREIVESVAVTGKAEPIEVQSVQSEIMGVVEEVLKDYNDLVKVGDILVRLSSDLQRVALDEAIYKLSAAETALLAAESGIEAAKAGQDGAQAALAKAHAGVSESENKLSAARRLRDQAKENYDNKLISKLQFDATEDNVKSAQAGVDAAKSTVDQAKAGILQATSMLKKAQESKAAAKAQIEGAKVAVTAAKLSLDKTELKSPMVGMVLSKDVRKGDTVGRPKVSLTDTSSGLFEIAAPLDKMRAIVKVSEADYSRVKKGQTATFSIDAYPDAKFTAMVSQVRNSPINDRTAVAYATVLEFANRRADDGKGDWMVKPGATVSADLEIRRVRNVLTIKNAAILFFPKSFDLDPPKLDNPAKQRVIWVKGPDGKPLPKVIEVGITDGAVTEIVSGELKEGDKVITSEPTPQKKILKLPFGG